MTRLILYLYDTLKSRRLLRWVSLVVSTAVLALLITQQSYKEDIADFLPLDAGQQENFRQYQSHANAQRIYVVFEDSTGVCQEADDEFCEQLYTADSTHQAVCLSTDDPAVVEEALHTAYSRIPYLLTAADYRRIDSLMNDSAFVTKQLEHNKLLLMLPTAGMTTVQMQYDPLHLFDPVLQRIMPAANTGRHMLLIDSPYGASETERNAQLIDLLQQIADSTSNRFPSVAIHFTGGPIIAVCNARQIKTDSALALSIATVLILLLLWYQFRSMRHLALIALSIAWGWLFAMGCLALVRNGVSIIVVGISSVILGIAVNYPLHLIAHLPHAADVRSALKEIVMPLVVGNVTTVAAFLTLVPLNAVALSDLGLFSAFLLVGTIVFVLLWLPHLVRRVPRITPPGLHRLVSLRLENKPWMVCVVAVLTLVLGYFSLQTSFDADLHHINYLTEQQRNDMQSLEAFSIPPGHEADLRQWDEWRTSKGLLLCRQVCEAGLRLGYADGSFEPFRQLVTDPPAAEGPPAGSTIVANISDNFNYIGWGCSCIVFFFLWLSLGSIELALLSFLPMAVSWIWILGLMALCGIQFNVVNIILATFIFGQGDDYTIFMTEGCQYEYAYRRHMLDSYKQSIIISALVMFTGIGALIVARHPALYSLAEVTMIGMFSVVLMACLLPPLIFRWLVYADGRERLRPITISNLLNRHSADPTAFVLDCYRYRGIEIVRGVRKSLRTYSSKGYWQYIEQRLLPATRIVLFVNSGWGETVILLALQHPDLRFIAIEKDPDQACVARHVAEQRVPNLSFADSCLHAVHQAGDNNGGIQAILLAPSADDMKACASMNPIIIQ